MGARDCASSSTFDWANHVRLPIDWANQVIMSSLIVCGCCVGVQLRDHMLRLLHLVWKNPHRYPIEMIFSTGMHKIYFKKNERFELSLWDL